jgi:hypothetical protein
MPCQVTRQKESKKFLIHLLWELMDPYFGLSVLTKLSYGDTRCKISPIQKSSVFLTLIKNQPPYQPSTLPEFKAQFSNIKKLFSSALPFLISFNSSLLTYKSTKDNTFFIQVQAKKLQKN